MFAHLHEIRSQYMMKKIRKGSVERMIKKYRIRLTEDEQNIIINGLLNLRNQLIKEGKYTTDAIDDLLLKLLD